METILFKWKIILDNLRKFNYNYEVEDDANTVYEIEMQAKREKQIGKRSRYYHSAIDINALAAVEAIPAE